MYERKDGQPQSLMISVPNRLNSRYHCVSASLLVLPHSVQRCKVLVYTAFWRHIVCLLSVLCIDSMNSTAGSWRSQARCPERDLG